MCLPRAIRAVLQPHYIYRPSQLLKRFYREWFADSASLQTVALPWGSRIKIDPSEHIGRSVWLHGLYDTSVCEVLWRLSNPGMTAADVGANIGVMTALLAHKTAPSGTVYSFEPHPGLYEALTKNVHRIRQHDKSTVYPFPFALSNKVTERPLTWTASFRRNQGIASISEEASDPNFVSVPCTTLDSLFPTAEIDILKLDVEGHEANVVEGAKGMLKEGRIGHLIYECLKGQRAPLHSILEQYGYEVFGIEERFTGPKLTFRCEVSESSRNTSSSYLASKTPKEVEAAFSQTGWRCLRGASEAVTRHG